MRIGGSTWTSPIPSRQALSSEHLRRSTGGGLCRQRECPGLRNSSSPRRDARHMFSVRLTGNPLRCHGQTWEQDRGKPRHGAWSSSLRMESDFGARPVVPGSFGLRLRLCFKEAVSLAMFYVYGWAMWTFSFNSAIPAFQLSVLATCLLASILVIEQFFGRMFEGNCAGASLLGGTWPHCSGFSNCSSRGPVYIHMDSPWWAQPPNLMRSCVSWLCGRNGGFCMAECLGQLRWK